MFSVSRSAFIDTPPARVFAAYVDFDSWLDWVPHFRELTPLSSGPLSDGALAPGFRARVRETYSVLPAAWEVVEVREGRSFAWRNRMPFGLTMTVDHIAEPEREGTLATLRLDVDGPLALLATPWMSVLTRRTFDRSLMALKARLEG